MVAEISPIVAVSPTEEAVNLSVAVEVVAAANPKNPWVQDILRQ